MTPEREAELFVKLDLMLESHRRTKRGIQALREEIRDVRDELCEFRTCWRSLDDAISRIEERLDERSTLIQLALADSA